MLQKYYQFRFLLSFNGFFHNLLPFCLRIRSSMHNDTSQKMYAASKACKNVNKELHIFKNLYPWKTLSDFSSHLQSSIVYNEGGLIVLNKPYGVRIHKRNKTGDDTAQGAINLASQEDFPYSVEDCIPHLKSHLNVSDLLILKSAERYTSGIVVLGCGEAVKNKIKKSQNVAKNEKVPQYIYWAITNGDPLYPAMRQKVGIKLIDLKTKNEKQPVILKHFSKSQVLQKKIKQVIVEHRTIATNKETSTAILEIAVSSVKWHFLKVYASSQMCGILGDTMYGPRMRKLLGQPINMNPENILGYDVQPLSESLCQRLDLPKTADGHLLVPTMLHFRTLVLPRYLKDKDLIINAPAPPHFTWTSSRLDFILPD